MIRGGSFVLYLSESWLKGAGAQAGPARAKKLASRCGIPGASPLCREVAQLHGDRELLCWSSVMPATTASSTGLSTWSNSQMVIKENLGQYQQEGLNYAQSAGWPQNCENTSYQIYSIAICVKIKKKKKKTWLVVGKTIVVVCLDLLK